MFTIAAAEAQTGEDSNDEWLGFVSEVKKFIEKNNKKVKVA